MPQLTGSFIVSGSITITGSNGSVTFGGNNNLFYTGVTISGSLAQGDNTLASGNFSHAEGILTTASNNAHAEGLATQALGAGSHAEGSLTITYGQMSHAEGGQTAASGFGSHTEGFLTTTTTAAIYSHAEGFYAGTTAPYSHAEGISTSANGLGSHAEGNLTAAQGTGSHAEGSNSIANAPYSHAEGVSTTANGTGSHAGGYLTVASKNYQTVFGEYNKLNNTSSLFAIGTGNASNSVDGFSVDRISGSAFISTVLLPLVSSSLNYANDSAAATGGVPLGGLYHANGIIRIRLT